MAYFEKDSNGNFMYSYCGVGDIICGEYVDPTLIEAYLEDETFEMAVKNSYYKWKNRKKRNRGTS